MKALKGKYRDIGKVTSSELLAKQATKKIIIYKNMYTLELLLNIFIAEIEAILISGKEFLYTCVKEVCRL
jgi:hypothetical protein